MDKKYIFTTVVLVASASFLAFVLKTTSADFLSANAKSAARNSIIGMRETADVRSTTLGASSTKMVLPSSTIVSALISDEDEHVDETKALLAAIEKQSPETIVVFLDSLIGESSSVKTRFTTNTPAANSVAFITRFFERMHEQTTAPIENKEIINEQPKLISQLQAIFPAATVVPVVVENKMSTTTLREFARLLAKNLPEKSVVLARVRFLPQRSPAVKKFAAEVFENVLKTGNAERLARTHIADSAGLYTLFQFNAYAKAQTFSPVVFIDTPNSTFFPLGYFSSGAPDDTTLVGVHFFGDIMLDRNVAKAMGKKGLEYVFEKMIPPKDTFLTGADFVIANLEGPFAKARVKTSKSIAFRFDPALAPQLKKYGFSGFSLANNHSLDMGLKNVDFTRRLLEENGLGHFGDQIREGAEYTWFARVPGTTTTIAFVGINTTDHSIERAKVKNALAEARKKATYVFVMMHWGVEYKQVSRIDERNLAHLLLDEGADAIIGAHPHVVEEMELYKEKPIFYSLGNFVFDQYFSKETQEGLSVGLTFEEGKVKNIYLFPFAEEKSQPQLMEGKRRDDFLEWFSTSSRVGGKKIEQGKI